MLHSSPAAFPPPFREREQAASSSSNEDRENPLAACPPPAKDGHPTSEHAHPTYQPHHIKHPSALLDADMLSAACAGVYVPSLSSPLSCDASGFTHSQSPFPPSLPVHTSSAHAAEETSRSHLDDKEHASVMDMSVGDGRLYKEEAGEECALSGHKLARLEQQPPPPLHPHHHTNNMRRTRSFRAPHSDVSPAAAAQTRRSTFPHPSSHSRSLSSLCSSAHHSSRHSLSTSSTISCFSSCSGRVSAASFSSASSSSASSSSSTCACGCHSAASDSIPGSGYMSRYGGSPRGSPCSSPEPELVQAPSLRRAHSECVESESARRRLMVEEEEEELAGGTTRSASAPGGLMLASPASSDDGRAGSCGEMFSDAEEMVRGMRASHIAPGSGSVSSSSLSSLAASEGGACSASPVAELGGCDVRGARTRAAASRKRRHSRLHVNPSATTPDLASLQLPVQTAFSTTGFVEYNPQPQQSTHHMEDGAQLQHPPSFVGPTASFEPGSQPPHKRSTAKRSSARLASYHQAAMLQQQQQQPQQPPPPQPHQYGQSRPVDPSSYAPSHQEGKPSLSIIVPQPSHPPVHQPSVYLQQFQPQPHTHQQTHQQQQHYQPTVEVQQAVDSCCNHPPAAATAAAAPVQQAPTVPAASTSRRTGPVHGQPPSPSRASLVSVLSCVLEQLFSNPLDTLPSDPSQISLFHTERIPSVSIGKYLHRIAHYSECSEEALVMAFIHISRIYHASNAAPTTPNSSSSSPPVRRFHLNTLSIHRLLLTAILCSAKFYDDQYFNNAFYSKVGGVSLRELNSLEVEFLSLVAFDLLVPSKIYRRFYRELSNAALHPHCSCAFRQLPELVFSDELPQSPSVDCDLYELTYGFPNECERTAQQRVREATVLPSPISPLDGHEAVQASQMAARLAQGGRSMRLSSRALVSSTASLAPPRAQSDSQRPAAPLPAWNAPNHMHAPTHPVVSSFSTSISYPSSSSSSSSSSSHLASAASHLEGSETKVFDE